MNPGSMQTKVNAQTYKKAANELVSVAVKTIYDDVKKRGFDTAAIKRDKAAILEPAKEACRNNIATFLTTILNHDDDLPQLYGMVQVSYNTEKKAFDLTLKSSLSVGEPAAKPAPAPVPTPPSSTTAAHDLDSDIELTGSTAETPVAKLVVDRENKIRKALKDLDDAISADLDAAFDSAVTDLEGNATRYKRTALHYKATGITLTVLAYMAEAGAIAATIPLFMEGARLTELYNAAADQIPGWGNLYVSTGHGTGHFTQAFYSLDAHGQKLVLDTMGLADQAMSHIGPGVIVICIAAMLMGVTWMIARELEEKGGEKVQEEMREKLGVQPIIEQQDIKKAEQAVDNNTVQLIVATTETDATSAAAKMAQKLNGFKAELINQAERVSEQDYELRL